MHPRWSSTCRRAAAAWSSGPTAMWRRSLPGGSRPKVASRPGPVRAASCAWAPDPPAVTVRGAVEDQHAAEQRYIDGLYARLEELRVQTAARLADVRLYQTRHPQALLERDAEIHHLGASLARYDVAGTLCFGRLDLEAGPRYYVGRVGISDDSHDPLLIDWRAPAAEP